LLCFGLVEQQPKPCQQPHCTRGYAGKPETALAFGATLHILLLMNKGYATLFCSLAAVVLGFADLRLPHTGSCPAAESCCCSDPETADPCLCVDHPPSDTPEIASFIGSAAPPAGEFPTGEITPRAGLPPKWRPSVPWHAPPKETRARLSVWIL
jgi:hypothetical protein